MAAMATIHVISKSLSAALLIVTNPSWLLYCMGGETGFYFFQKLLRRDLIYCKTPVPKHIHNLEKSLTLPHHPSLLSLTTAQGFLSR